MEKHTIMFGFNSNERRIAKLNRTQEGFTWLNNLETKDIILKYSEEIAVEQHGISLLLHGKLYDELQWEKKQKEHIQDVNNDPPGNLRTQMLSMLKLRLEQCDIEKFDYVLQLWAIHIHYWDYYLNNSESKTSYDCYEIATKNVLKKIFAENEYVEKITIGNKNLAIAPKFFMKKACDTMDEIVKDNLINKKSKCYKDGYYGKVKEDYIPIFKDIKEFINVMGISIPEEVFNKFS